MNKLNGNHQRALANTCGRTTGLVNLYLFRLGICSEVLEAPRGATSWIGQVLFGRDGSANHVNSLVERNLRKTMVVVF